MITIWQPVVLGIVLCVSSAGTLAQDQDQDYEALVKVLAAGDPNVEALAMHRLTVRNVRQLFAVDRELLELRKTVPDLDTRVAELRRRFDPQGRTGSAAVDGEAKAYEAIPEIAQILQRQKMSGREYLRRERLDDLPRGGPEPTRLPGGGAPAASLTDGLQLLDLPCRALAEELLELRGCIAIFVQRLDRLLRVLQGLFPVAHRKIAV